MKTVKRVLKYKALGGNRRLAKVAVQCSADTFVVNQSLVLRINPDSYRDGEIATFANPENVMPNAMTTTKLTANIKLFSRN
jgi:hypothetical protein